MRFSGAHFEYDVIKLEYVDYENNSDKFYTVVIDRQNMTWWAHYGRNGTTGTTTQPKSIGRANAGVKKAREKIDKGYEVVEQGLASFAVKPPSRAVVRATLRERKII